MGSGRIHGLTRQRLRVDKGRFQCASYLYRRYPLADNHSLWRVELLRLLESGKYCQGKHTEFVSSQDTPAFHDACIAPQQKRDHDDRRSEQGSFFAHNLGHFDVCEDKIMQEGDEHEHQNQSQY